LTLPPAVTMLAAFERRGTACVMLRIP